MPSQVEQLIGTHPGRSPIDEKKLSRIIEQLYECARTCTTCGDACLGEDDPRSQTACITSCQNCAEVCITTARALSRITGFNREAMRHLVEACVEICRLCADECGRHASQMEHCRLCSETCRSCADACRSLLEELQAA